MRDNDNKKRIVGIAALGVVTAAALGLSYGLKVQLGKSKYATAKVERDLQVMDVFAEGGVKEAHELADGSYQIQVATKGFGGDVVLSVYVEADKKTLRGVEVVSQSETDGYGAKIVSDPSVLKQFEGVQLPVYSEKVTNAGLNIAQKEDSQESAGEAKELKDGVYTKEGDAGNGYTDVVSLTVKDGAIGNVTIDSYDQDGNYKSKLAAEGKYMMTETGLTWDKQAEALAAYVLEHQGVNSLAIGEDGKTDGIAGVSIAVGGMVNLIKECLIEASGEAVPVLADGVYSEEGDAGNGYTDVVTLTVKDGVVAGVTIDSYDQDGNYKSKLAAEGKYMMTETGLTWDKQAEALAAYVLEHQGVNSLAIGEDGKTDGIAGVSIAVGGMVNLIETCLRSAAGSAELPGAETEGLPEGATLVDGVSGATVTTRAVLSDINKAYLFLNQE